MRRSAVDRKRFRKPKILERWNSVGDVAEVIIVAGGLDGDLVSKSKSTGMGRSSDSPN